MQTFDSQDCWFVSEVDKEDIWGRGHSECRGSLGQCLVSPAKGSQVQGGVKDLWVSSSHPQAEVGGDWPRNLLYALRLELRPT